MELSEWAQAVVKSLAIQSETERRRIRAFVDGRFLYAVGATKVQHSAALLAFAGDSDYALWQGKQILTAITEHDGAVEAIESLLEALDTATKEVAR